MPGKDRKKELARQRYLRQQAHREQQHRRARRWRLVGSIVAVVLVISASAGLATVFVGNDSSQGDGLDSAAAASSTPQPPESVAPGECAYQPTSVPEQGRDVGKPPKKPAHEGTVRATLRTSLGNIGLELDGANAPCTVNSMVFLAEKNYFDDTSCHRLVTAGIQVLQCGDPTGTGTGGPGYQFANENTEGAQYTRGVLAMANAGPDTNGSQFFIVYGDSTSLPPDYTVFGRVTRGLNIVNDVAAAGASAPDPASGNTAPNKKIEIRDVTIAKN